MNKRGAVQNWTLLIVAGGLSSLIPFARAEKPSAAAVVQSVTAQADKLYEAKQWGPAAAEYAAFTRTNANDPAAASAYYKEGVCHRKLDQTDDALRCWNWLLQRYPTSPSVPDVLEQLIALQQSRSNPSEVAALSDELVAKYPKHPAAVKLLGIRAENAMNAHRYDEAVKLFETIQPALSPEQRRKMELARTYGSALFDPNTLITTADSALKVNDFTKAASLLESYLAKSGDAPRATEARVKLGWAYYCAGGDKNLQHAENLWREVTQQGSITDEWVAESQWHLVQLMAGPRGNWKEAVRVCEFIVKTLPVGSFRHEQALYTRAWLLKVNQQWPEALAAFDQYVQAYPLSAKHPPIIAYLEECHRMAGK